MTFHLSGDSKISVTENHAMLVFDDQDKNQKFTHKDLMLARDVKVGMKFRTFKDGKVQLSEVEKITMDVSESVYNIVGPHYNILANDVIVSDLGDVTMKYPEYLYTAGQTVYEWIGPTLPRALYRFFDALETKFTSKGR